jgi:hypothetical protein
VNVKSLLSWLATFVAALVVGGAGVLFVATLGLILIEWIAFPLALVVGGLLAALSAGWVGNWQADDGSRTRLASAIAVVEAAALALALVVLVSARLREALLGPLLGLVAFCSLLLAAIAAVATWGYRRPANRPLTGDLTLTLTLLAVATIGVPTVVLLAAFSGLGGA